MASPETTTVAEPAAEPPSLGLRATGLRAWLEGRRLAAVIVAVEMLALAIFGASQARVMVMREDEVLALFVGRSSLGGTLHQVLTERGGAPLHFLTSWTVIHLGGRLIALRLVSVAFVVASLPVIALLAARLARDTRAGVVAALLAGPCWLVLFAADFARMYAEFLFFSTLSALLLLRAYEKQRWRDWTWWWLASVAALASHAYGAFVLFAGIVALLVEGRRRLRTWVVCAAPIVLAAPMWGADLVLRDRFSVSAGGGGDSLGSLHEISHFLATTFRDATAWHGPVLWIAVVLFPIGAYLVLRRTGKVERVFVVLVFALPIVALLGARADSHVSPETRHLIFLLPFIDLFLATALVTLASRIGRAGAVAGVAVLAVVVVGQLQSAKVRTPDLFVGQPTRVESRQAAGEWLAGQAPRDALLVGYEQVFYEAWAHDPHFSALEVARADPIVAAKQLERHCGHFDGAALVFDKSNGYKIDLTNADIERLRQRIVAAGYTAKRFGDFLVALSSKPDGDPAGFIDDISPMLLLASKASVDNGRLEYETLQRAKTLLPSSPC